MVPTCWSLIPFAFFWIARSFIYIFITCFFLLRELLFSFVGLLFSYLLSVFWLISTYCYMTIPLALDASLFLNSSVPIVMSLPACLPAAYLSINTLFLLSDTFPLAICQLLPQTNTSRSDCFESF